MMDNSTVRRGRPAWHVKDNRGLAAFNDAILIEAGLYSLLRKHFREEPYYTDVLELFHSVGIAAIVAYSYLVLIISLETLI